MDKDRQKKERKLYHIREWLSSLKETYSKRAEGSLKLHLNDDGFNFLFKINDLEDEREEILASLSPPADAPSTDNEAPQPDMVEAPQPDMGQSGPINKKRSRIFDFLDHGKFKSELLADGETEVLFGGVKLASGPSQSPEEEKVAYLYTMLTGVGNEEVTSDAVFEALVDLCRLDNEDILYKALRVLHKALADICPMDAGSIRRVRENVIFQRASSRENTAEVRIGNNVIVEGSTSIKSTEISGLQFDDFSRRTRSTSPKSSFDWIDVFKLMSQIATRNIKKRTRLEAVTVMNLLLRRTNAYGSDRRSFGRVLGYQAITQLLDEESGVDVQKEAVKLLFLLVNCPGFKSIFLLDCKKLNGDAKEVQLTEEVDAAEIGGIRERLRGMIASRGKSTAELELRRKVIELWGFLVTSSGFEAFISYLEVILPMLGSEVDAGDPNEEEVFKERNLLIREVLTHINQLLSQPHYKKHTLENMMYDEDSRGLVIGIADRLSRDPECHMRTNTLAIYNMKLEVAALGRSFKESVFGYLDSVVES